MRNRKTTFLHQCDRCEFPTFYQPHLIRPLLCSIQGGGQLDSSVLDDPLLFDSAVGESS